VVSHLPQLLSTALASLIADVPQAARVAGPAAIDLTRLALSPYDIWRDIFATNSAEIDRVIRDAIARLQTLRENLLSERDMQATFARAAKAASELRQS
jgi:prephenate dehydrogenase